VEGELEKGHLLPTTTHLLPTDILQAGHLLPTVGHLLPTYVLQAGHLLPKPALPLPAVANNGNRAKPSLRISKNEKAINIDKGL